MDFTATPLLAIPLGAALIGFLVLLIVYLLVMGFVLWLAGEIVVGRRVTFGEALAIAAIGTFLVASSIAVLAPFIGIFAYLVGLLLFLGLVKHYFRTGWIGAIAVGIVAIIVFIVLIFILGILALAAFFALPRIPF
ncbi:MAG TPA: hypothetical protein VFE98_06350 [Candidatus Bathyarchaeia archaeon]|nr:hypothetical protein [Candidatus Bathyarchaeia archaeon]